MWRFSIVRTQRVLGDCGGMFLSVKPMDVFFCFCFFCSWKFNRSRVSEDSMKRRNGCGCEGESRSFTPAAVRRLARPSSRVSRLIRRTLSLTSRRRLMETRAQTHTHAHITDNQVRGSRTPEASQAADAHSLPRLRIVSEGRRLNVRDQRTKESLDVKLSRSRRLFLCVLIVSSFTTDLFWDSGSSGIRLICKISGNTQDQGTINY